METAQVVTAVAGPMGAAGAAHYFHPATLAKGKELGLDGLRFYFLGRGGVLGDVSARVIQSAFGYFNAPMIDKIWTSAKERVEPRAAADALLGANADLGREKLADVAGLAEYCDAAEQVIAAAHPAGLTLFAGISGMPVPDDLPGKAIHQTAVLRELRGSVHLLAIAAVGLDNTSAHVIRRPDDVQMFGYETTPEVTEHEVALLAEADTLTDRMMAVPYGALDAAQGAALVEGATAIQGALT
ncbi:MAG: hypothetical protein AAF531_12700 [Actinomycetota bacterium]